jgi:hypothetical protein
MRGRIALTLTVLRYVVKALDRRIAKDVTPRRCKLLGSTDCQSVVAGSPAGNIFDPASSDDFTFPSRQAAEICRLAACAPQMVFAS